MKHTYKFSDVEEAYLRLRANGLSMFEANTIIILAWEYAKAGHGKWRYNT